MTFTYDAEAISTDLAIIRTIIQDTDSANAFFTDEQIAAFLDLESDDVRYAAALALESWSSNQLMILKKIELLDIKTDGPAMAREMRARAAGLRQQAESGDEIEVVEWLNTPFAHREALWNDILRTS